MKQSGKSFGVRLDVVKNLHLFETQSKIKNLMKFFKNCGIKFLHLESIFSSHNGEQNSLFAINPKILTWAVLNQSSENSNLNEKILQHFQRNNTSSSRAEFSNFCDNNSFWIDSYAMFCAIVEHTKISDFSKWPDLIRICHRKTADIINKQLTDQILSHKIIQFFSHKQLKLIKDFANAEGIFLGGDCDILCDYMGADVWKEQQSFFVNDASKPTVFIGLPESAVYKFGIKTRKIPYRVGFLKNSEYRIFSQMFSYYEKIFNAVFLINSHTIYQYWEVACYETDARHGRWVNVSTDPFFSHLDSHFNNFPYLFDFNEPLFPENEVISKRHNMIPVVIDGEPLTHSCDIYNLNRKIFAICSSNCDKKLKKLDISTSNSSNLKSLIEKFKTNKQVICIINFDEMINEIGYSSGEFKDCHIKEFLKKFEISKPDIQNGYFMKSNVDKKKSTSANFSNEKKSVGARIFSKFFK